MSLGKAVNHTVPQFPHLTSRSEDATFLEGCRWGLSGIIQRAGPRLLGLHLSEPGLCILLPAGVAKGHREPRFHTYLPPCPQPVTETQDHSGIFFLIPGTTPLGSRFREDWLCVSQRTFSPLSKCSCFFSEIRGRKEEAAEGHVCLASGFRLPAEGLGGPTAVLPLTGVQVVPSSPVSAPLNLM